MKKLPFVILVSLLFVACSSKKVDKDKDYEDPLEFSTYDNEYYTVEYPSHWEVSENISDKAQGLEQYEGNDKMTLQQHEVDLLSYDGVNIHIVKSNFHFDLPVEDYADMSVLSKGFADAGEYQDDIDQILQSNPNKYLDFWRNDSISFAGRRAVLQAFEFINENNDTLVQKQIVVQNGKGDTFFVNSTFFSGDEAAEELGDIILDSFKLK